VIARSIAVVSGKGGAGKTMLAVAITHELALRSRTLIVDLDAFNRGLSGLLRNGKKIADVPAPDFFSGGEESEGWSLLEVAPNVVTLTYPDITRAQRQRVESLSIADLTADLEIYITRIRDRSGCEEVVLDCHGGPDMLSFAAVSACSQSILVSEPDRITFYGTLHFLRRMAEDCPSVRPDIRLVFNKVMPAFSERYLKRFYDAEIKDLFRGEALLAVVPFEAYLSKEFERFPFVTQVYPYSQLAGKARAMVRKLRLDGECAAGTSSQKNKGLWPKMLTGSGRFVPRFMNLEATTSFTAPALVVVVLIAALSTMSGPLNVLSDYALIMATMISLWFVEVMLVNWVSVLDRIFTRQIRLRRFLSAASSYFLVEATGLMLAVLAGSTTEYACYLAGNHGAQAAARTATGTELSALDPLRISGLASFLFSSIAFWVAYNLAIRTVIAIWHEKRYVEGSLRALACLSGIFAAGLVVLVSFHMP
jgi:cellulose biosynthesis protein BcsQ